MKSFPLFRAALFLGMSMSIAAAATNNTPERARQFMVMGYQGITAELDSGRGPYLRTLLDLLGVSPGQQPQTIEQLRTFSKSYPNIMDFADHVLEKYAPVPAAAPVLAASTPTPDLEPLPTGPHVYAGGALENALIHLGKGMKITVYPKTGARVSGTFNDYDAKRLWIRASAALSFRLDEIRAVEAPDL